MREDRRSSNYRCRLRFQDYGDDRVAYAKNINVNMEAGFLDNRKAWCPRWKKFCIFLAVLGRKFRELSVARFPHFRSNMHYVPMKVKMEPWQGQGVPTKGISFQKSPHRFDADLARVIPQRISDTGPQMRRKLIFRKRHFARLCIKIWKKKVKY